MAKQKYNSKLTISEMLIKLNELFNKEERLIAEVKRLYVEYQQLQEDKEMLQNFIMHQSNRNSRIRRFMKNDTVRSIR